MNSRLARSTVAGIAAVALAALCVWQTAGPARAENEKDKADPALDRTRKQVAMLDDIYKHAVVLITTHYVEEDSDLPAGTAAKALFAYASRKGYHDVRLLDVAGEPISDDNIAKDAFEKTSIEKLKKGESWVEEVQKVDGRRVLRVATPIPVVHPKCVMCHENYRSVKEGAPIGALGYTVRIDE